VKKTSHTTNVNYLKDAIVAEIEKAQIWNNIKEMEIRKKNEQIRQYEESVLEMKQKLFQVQDEESSDEEVFGE